MAVVIVLKEGRNLSTVKGWRPIVLMCCLLTLIDKVVADEFQISNLFHHKQFRSCSRKGAMDMAI